MTPDVAPAYEAMSRPGPPVRASSPGPPSSWASCAPPSSSSSPSSPSSSVRRVGSSPACSSSSPGPAIRSSHPAYGTPVPAPPAPLSQSPAGEPKIRKRSTPARIRSASAPKGSLAAFRLTPSAPATIARPPDGRPRGDIEVRAEVDGELDVGAEALVLEAGREALPGAVELDEGPAAGDVVDVDRVHGVDGRALARELVHGDRVVGLYGDRAESPYGVSDTAIWDAFACTSPRRRRPGAPRAPRRRARGRWRSWGGGGACRRASCTPAGGNRDGARRRRCGSPPDRRRFAPRAALGSACGEHGRARPRARASSASSGSGGTARVIVTRPARLNGTSGAVRRLPGAGVPALEVGEPGRRRAVRRRAPVAARGERAAARTTFGPFGSAERLNCAKAKKRRQKTSSQRRISGRS